MSLCIEVTLSQETPQELLTFTSSPVTPHENLGGSERLDTVTDIREMPALSAEMSVAIRLISGDSLDSSVFVEDTSSFTPVTFLPSSLTLSSTSSILLILLLMVRTELLRPDSPDLRAPSSVLILVSSFSLDLNCSDRLLRFWSTVWTSVLRVSSPGAY